VGAHMKIFIIHKSEDRTAVENLMQEINSRVNVDLLALQSNKDDKHWRKEAKAKIDQSDLILYILGEITHTSTFVDEEIQYALKKKKQILLYRLRPEYKDVINGSLIKKDSFNNTNKELFKEISLEDLPRVLKQGYDFDIARQLEQTKDPKRETELIEQYKAYLQTSEDILNRRQNTSNFYTTLNTTMLTILATAAGLLFSLSGINGMLATAVGMFSVSIMGILLNLNWLSLLESYGRLNSAKMKVISEIEKNLPANIYDTEWRVMSEKLCGGKYISFTAIEKRLPICFVVLYGLLICLSMALFVISII